ncbi:MAG TPA: TonB-dependent receptor [Steroidobacteraceae bacterium]|jgi:iron complex outermembrane receptor protein|nr:TonB-dependent receptor [Steroidobacteraceae bacterium]
MHRLSASRKFEKALKFVGVVCAISGVCFAEALAADATTDSGDTLQEVTITATKRLSTVQTTPISVTAVTSEELTARGVTSFDDLAQSVPGMSMRTSGSGQTEFEMRGLQSSGGSSSTVGFYLDETPLSSPASAQNGKVVIDPNLYDLSRVEVLRGPQGTLYGSGSMGGTVRLVPNAPELGAFDASGETIVSDTASGGSINTAQNGMLNLPLGSTAAVRIVGALSQTSGWVQRIVIQDGQFPLDYDNAAGTLTRGNVQAAPVQMDYTGSNKSTTESTRASLLWSPIEQLTIEPMVMYQLTNQDGPSATDTTGISPSVSGPEAHYEPYDTPEPYSDRFTLGSLKVAYQFESFSVTSATADWNRKSFISQDSTEENAVSNAGLGTIPAILPNPTVGTYDVTTGAQGPNSPATWERDYTQQISEEIRAASTSDSAFQWLGGFFYSKLDSTWSMSSNQPEATAATLESAFGVDNPAVFTAFEPATIKQTAVFGEVSYKLTPDFKITAGARRFSYDTTQSDNEGGAELSGEPGQYPMAGVFESKQVGVTPKLDLSYQITPDMMVYATGAKGFRPGGVNQFLPTTCPPGTVGGCFASFVEGALQSKFNTTAYVPSPQTFAADDVWNYELGAKTEFLDHRLMVNGDVYYEIWNDPQLLTNADGFGYTVNGAKAKMTGLELETKALLTSSLTLAVNVSYDHAYFVDDNAPSGFLAGQEVADTPKITSAQTLTYKFPMANGMTILGVLENDYVGNRTDIPYGLTLSIYGNTTQRAIVHLAAYDLTKLRFGVQAGNWSAMLFVDNLLNKAVLEDPQPQIDLALLSFQRYTVSQPLTAGIDLNYKFGGK